MPHETIAPDSAEGDAHISELVRFEGADAYFATQESFLALQLIYSDAQASELLTQLESEISVYQDQAYLLDPYLDRLISPSAQALQVLIQRQDPLEQEKRETVWRYCRLIYAYTKVRGYKIVMRFLPHDVADMQPLIAWLQQLLDEPARQKNVPWETVYILLLWLSLVALIPFDLENDDEQASIAERIVHMARTYLSYPGKERDGASVLLGNMLGRRAAQGAHFTAFLRWAELRMLASCSAFEATGILQTLCAITKHCDAHAIGPQYEGIAAVLALYAPWMYKSALVDRFRIKLTGRLAIQLLAADADDDRIDTLVDALLQALLYPDSNVRFSAAKGIARVCKRLPKDMSAQVVEAILDQLPENVRGADIPEAALAAAPPSQFDPDVVRAMDLIDVSAVSEASWHGVFLALAECTRRALISIDLLARTMYWTLHGLLFDLRRSANAVGNSVRDACCYVLWALARVRNTESLVPFLHSVAQRLVVIATLDREVTIRRAASAAFQEWVGRTSQIPFGIQVLRKTDFSAVGIRRHAYVDSAPAIAHYQEYRDALLAHIQRVCLVHWDVNVRVLGAIALQKIVAQERALLPDVVHVQIKALAEFDSARVHGALLALVHMCTILDSSQAPLAAAVMQGVLAIQPTLFSAPGASLLMETACRVVATSAPHGVTNNTDRVLELLHTAAARPEESVHEALAEAVEALQGTPVAAALLARLLDAWSDVSLDEQRSGALVLGALGADGAEQRLALLCNLFDPLAHVYVPDVETRRNAAKALSTTIKAAPALFATAANAAFIGLTDFTTDQRGDVGSWVRSACISALEDMVQTMRVSKMPIHHALMRTICVGMVPCVMERIDTLRATACSALGTIAAHAADDEGVPARGIVCAALGATPAIYRDARTAYPMVMPFLEIDSYRASILPTLAKTIGSRSESVVKDASDAFAHWMQQVDVSHVRSVLQDLLRAAACNVRDNRLFVPLLQTMYLVLERDVYTRDASHFDGLLLRMLRVANTHIGTVRSIPRIAAAARITVQSLRISTLKESATQYIAAFLTHRYPTVRMQTSEQLLLLLQTDADVDEALEECLLSTQWCTGTTEQVSSQTEQVIALLKNML
ncbi:hypothetical protein MVES1_001867 [Malassezia vespertilionis]|uniref:Uncharacterized protein n=1 Tax=Malassezia vespertilionis TaxID=2020962 RepID=A0A2N1JDI8_9BASI|nr:uncharacterized protein MVES1_001867 [Malassezia vespertilionis]PKI84620.1 hypothetical protein MVES_001768 [Malassezia vespertilionis]WFD06520.1 hypothetical protein MVES1_001867 [Malassezia vespertilionis]